MKSQLSLLTKKRFLPLFITQFLGAFNDNVFKNAFAILITYKIATLGQSNSQMLVTLAAGIFILPFFLFSALAGELADKFEKSRLISIIKLIEIIIMLLGTVGFYSHSIVLLMTVLCMLGMHSTFFGPLKYSILPDHLRENELIAGNGLIEAGTFLAILLGTILGGILILMTRGEFFISALVLLGAIAGWISSFYIPLARPDNPSLKIDYNIFKKTYELIRYSAHHKTIFISILGISWFWLIGAAFLTEFPIFTREDLHAEGRVVTYFLTLYSIGLGLGSLFCNKLLKGKIQATYVPIAALAISIFTIDLYFASRQPLTPTGYITLSQFLQTFTGWRITVDLLLTAVCGGLYTVPLYAILQYQSEKAHRARVIASNNVINSLFMVFVSIVIMFMLQAGFSVNEIFLTLAIVNVGVAFYLRKINRDLNN